MEKNAAALVFDFGASSGRAMLCRFDGGRLTLTEVHRFLNTPVTRGETLYWDFDTLFREVTTGIEKARDAGGFASIGVDTWGVDFGLIDNDGALLEAPVHYRDGRTNGLSGEVAAMLGDSALYACTGTQRMDINTLYQLYALKKTRPDFLRKAKHLLLMPDLFNYFLTGEKHAELTIASTTQMLDLNTKAWNTPLLQKLGLPADILLPPVAPGTRVGTLKDSLCKQLCVPPVPVIAVAAHDTASAVIAVPATAKDFIFISCGTWSLFGTETGEPIIDKNAQHCNLTNELGFGGTVTFLKNIIGLWLIQETRRQFAREGKDYSYAQMEQMAKDCPPFACFIDPDALEFVPTGDIPGRIRAFCQKTGQYVPQNDGEIVRCIYESLAMKYRFAFDQLKLCTGKDYGAIHLVGGGTKDSFLCQMTADATNIPVTAGPVEATALGNAAAQLISLGCIKSFEEARAIIRNSFTEKTFQPSEPALWARHFEKFKTLL
jgi:rhamnulokinase